MKILRYDLGRRVTAFSTERDAADVTDPYSGFNACHYTHGNPCEVAACRDMALRQLSGASAFVIPRQTHSLNVAVVDSPSVGGLDDVDALVTSLPRVALAVNTADCVPVLMADPAARVVAAVHSGWRGTAGHIAVKALDVMQRAGASSARVRVAMGPSICTCCFEVGEEVAEVFRSLRSDADGDIIYYNNVGGRPHIDLRRAIERDLTDAGVSSDNIYTGAPCSRCNWQRWWSARRMGIDSGRTLSVIMLDITL